MTPSCAVPAPEGRDDPQRALDKLEIWAHVNLMGFNEAKGLVDEKLDMSQQQVLKVPRSRLPLLHPIHAFS